MNYFFANDQDQRGPFPLAELLANGLRPDSLVWHEGMGDWQRADAVPEVAALFAGRTGPAPAVPQPAYLPQPPIYGPPTNQPYPPYGPNTGYYAPPPSLPVGASVTSMVLGIISLFICFWYVSIPCAILAIVFGNVARGKIARGEAGGPGMASAGIICGCIALALDALLIILIFTIGFSLFGGFH